MFSYFLFVILRLIIRFRYYQHDSFIMKFLSVFHLKGLRTTDIEIVCQDST